MKRISSFIIAIITLISLTVPAFADSSDYQNPDYISDPEMAKQWNENWAEYDRLKAEKEALTNQFHKDNPGVSEYILAPSSFSSELYYDIVDDALGFRTWYTGYHGSGYYKAGGRVTVYANYSSYNAIQLLPDPKPQVTKAYLAKIEEINKKMDEASEAAENAAIESMNQDAKMLQKITGKFWIDNDYNNHALLVFQIGNYMYAAGKANRTDFTHGHIVDNNRNAVPYVKNGHTMIPIRSVIEGLGGKVDWDPTLNGARCTLNGITITMPIGSEYAYINGEPVKMTTPAIVTNGRTMIPVRFVAENLGYDVDWISDGSYVVIRESSKEWISGYQYNVPDKFYQSGYGHDGYTEWCADIEYSYYIEYEDTDYVTTMWDTDIARVGCWITTIDNISDEVGLLTYKTTTDNNLRVYEGVENSDEAEYRLMMFQSEDSNLVMLVKGYYDYEVDETTEALDEFFSCVKNSVNPIFDSLYNENVK